MRIGLVSDSHGKVQALDAALSILLARDVDGVIHCGDICCLTSLRLLDSLGVPAWLVAGNMDKHLRGLDAATWNTGVTFSRSSVHVPLGNGDYLVAMHGDDEHLLDESIRGQQFPYVCHGHTHRMRDEMFGKTRVICPSALYDPRHPEFATAAILDTTLNKLDFYDIAHPDTPLRA